MSKAIKTSGTIIESMKDGMYRVQLDENPEHEVLCKLAGRFRQAKISLVLGDSVNIEISPYDLKKGRIIWRLS